MDITITATVRPDLLNQTLASFYKNCFHDFKDDKTIIINVDPIGDVLKYSENDVVKVCYEYTDNVIYNLPSKPNFAKAVKWVWSRCKSDYVFHLEDDWYLNTKINLAKMIRHMFKEDLSALRLYKKNYPKNKPYMMFDNEYKYNNNSVFIASNSGTQFGLNPVLIKKSFIDEALPLMVDNLNPEKQFRDKNERMKDFVLSHKYGIYGKPGMGPMVTDIGTDWREKRNIKKPTDSAFLTWNHN